MELVTEAAEIAPASAAPARQPNKISLSLTHTHTVSVKLKAKRVTKHYLVMLPCFGECHWVH